MGLCRCLFPTTRRYSSSSDSYLLESWLVKAGDQVGPLQIVALVQGPLEPGKSWEHNQTVQGKTQPVCIPTEKTETLELVTLSGSSLELSVVFSKEYSLPTTTSGENGNGIRPKFSNHLGLRMTEKVTGKVSSLMVGENNVVQAEQVVLCVDVCDHKVQFNGNCALCGLEMDMYATSPAESPRELSANRTDWTLSNTHHLNPAYTHPQLRVSRNELELVEGQNTIRLLKRRKLSLVLDLDNTLIHATLVSHFPQEWYQYKKELREQAEKEKVQQCNIPMLEDIHELDLDGSISLVKLRPNVRHFLENIHQRYELHIYTMGSRSYADAIATLLDPSGSLFQRRIVSRDDFVEGTMNRKSLRRIFPCDDSMVIIVDDREDVWLDRAQGEVVPNLIRARPYLFFVQDTHPDTNNTSRDCSASDSRMAFIQACLEGEMFVSKKSFADISTCMLNCLNWKENCEFRYYSPYLPWIQSATENDENYLGRLEQLLIQVHERFFAQSQQEECCYEAAKNLIQFPLRATNDVKLILAEMRHMVLRNCYIAFTGIFRLEESPEMSNIWRLAEEFGATCSKQVTCQTTHLIVDNQHGLHTGKTKYAMQRGDIFLVTLEWLETSMQFYLRASELQFASLIQNPSSSYGNDLEKYRKFMEQRHEQFMQNGQCHHSPPSPSKPSSSKRRKMEYSSSEEDTRGDNGWNSNSRKNQTEYHPPCFDETTVVAGHEESPMDQVELEWTASYLASKLEKELRNDPLCLSGSGEDK